jgi:hypothetical protein
VTGGDGSGHDKMAHDEGQQDVLDESLSRLAVTGPEFDGGLSNHGPMAAEAIIRLGRPDDVEPWLDSYIQRLEDAPRATEQITDQAWRAALGDPRRVADWEAYLRDQLAENPWQEVLARWWPRLVPGLAASATHGIIRTSHAARSLAAAQTGERVAELARGLAYWAATYLELPGAARTAGRLDLTAAVSGLPLAERRPAGGLITDQIRANLADDDRFGPAVEALRPPADVQADLLELASTFARVFLRFGSDRPIALLHAVTAPVAARSVLPLLPAELARPTYDALWQVDAALYAVFTPGVTPKPVPLTEPPGPETLTDRAVATGDVHAIKLTEACLRLHKESGDPILLHAAARAAEMLG